VRESKQGAASENSRFVDFEEGTAAVGLGAALRSVVSPKRCTTTCLVVCLTCTRCSGQETLPTIWRARRLLALVCVYLALSACIMSLLAFPFVVLSVCFRCLLVPQSPLPVMQNAVKHPQRVSMQRQSVSSCSSKGCASTRAGARVLRVPDTWP
jgi:hypothetical protein